MTNLYLFIFLEHDLDVFCIENISDSDINELIPKSKIKDRIKFKAGLAQFKNENKSLVSVLICKLFND